MRPTITKGLLSIFEEAVRQGDELDKQIELSEQRLATEKADLLALRELRQANQAYRDTLQAQGKARDAAEVAAQYQYSGRVN